ncbi:MAG: winged helix-turn-helix transcriptional regulator [Hamadaea sp.]|uniref:MarR family winged helix-turn-helix transcriptional regulator n=1 Tax=Hamadaea sp. TaxID=2024425 RepID=UPI001797A97C|nr:MarR family winged helix-turn-helix transcriptional regulator [Hamadaea sp.]NUR73853.1 winged helix-turn-helix transcriptional regulator [Hamadaea sp.]NUT18982.1 winged helix-turn-helix transcriptional regulator [Hamadaea sp.]
MTSVNDESRGHVFDLLGAALTVARRQMEAEVADEPQHLRGSHLRLLSLTPADGIRPTELAGVMGMTKQSLGEFVASMQKAGFLDVSPDPADGRARIVRPTAKGLRMQQRILEIFAGTEQRWRDEIGDHDWTIFRRVLARLAAEK